MVIAKIINKSAACLISGLSIISLSTGILIQPLHAQQSPQSKLDERAYKAVADSLGVNATNERMRSWLNNPQTTYSDAAKFEKAPVLKHIQGTQGIAFATPEEQVDKYLPDPNKFLNKAFLDKFYKSMRGQLEAQQKAFNKPRHFPDCKGSSSKGAETGYKNAKDGKQVKFDMLFIRKEDAPEKDNAEIFGNTVQVRAVAEDSIAFQRAMEGIKLECLPSRLRVTKELVIIDQGGNALKNYSKDPYAAGEVHPLVAELVAKYGG